jgi:hypothetical protein
MHCIRKERVNKMMTAVGIVRNVNRSLEKEEI